jgi:hypothetical protein
MICSSLNLVFFTSVSSRRRTLAQTGGVSGEHVNGAMMTELGYVDAPPPGSGRLSDRAVGELKASFEALRGRAV